MLVCVRVHEIVVNIAMDAKDISKVNSVITAPPLAHTTSEATLCADLSEKCVVVAPTLATMAGNDERHTSAFDKHCWIAPSEQVLDNLRASILSKLEKSHGELILSIGISEADQSGLTEAELDASSLTLSSLVDRLELSVSMLRQRAANADSSAARAANASTEGKFVRDYLIRRQMVEEDFIEVRVAVVGNVDSGKSTLLGVLTHCVLDDGRGDARTKLVITGNRKCMLFLMYLFSYFHGIFVHSFDTSTRSSRAERAALATTFLDSTPTAKW